MVLNFFVLIFVHCFLLCVLDRKLFIFRYNVLYWLLVFLFFFFVTFFDAIKEICKLYYVYDN
jgi:hypothetical protein